ncbi:MAG: hypothetical protein K2P42_04015 [Lachnospiraceae bacterium]|nr:hypothetical protein [Lachnospiraceae bacterium]MDE7002673.1 hypothetical protein [Lachnospiraceae bacterium]
MKNNSNKIRVISLTWTVIGVVLLILIWICDSFENCSMQQNLTYVVRLYAGISGIISGVIARLSKKGK